MKILETYRNAGYDKGGVNTVIIYDTDPDWNQKLWRDLMAANGIKPDQKPFQPTFLLAFASDFTGQKYEMNSRMFADSETASEIAKRYGTGVVREVEILGPGAFSVDRKAIEFELTDGRWVNAGAIASYFERNPEDTAPGVADKLIRSVLVSGTGDGQ